MIVVDTQYGRLEGERRNAHLVFRGVPFAKPPVGRLRFRAPEPPEPWPGVRSARSFGPSAIQRAPLFSMSSPPEPRREDCLYLNVFTPGVGGARRPVMVWIHGGGFNFGAGSEALYDGGRLAERGGVVVVTFNYRLGALGFLCLPDADRKRLDATANAGNLDQVAALRWVRDNIAAFGGDPNQVTLFGESAGAFSVSALLAMPHARGLFQRAVAQSGARLERIGNDPSHAARALSRALGASETDFERLWDVPAEQFVAAQEQVAAASNAALPNVSAFAPLHDGDTVPLPLSEAFASGACVRVPLMLGTTRDEINLFLGAAIKKLGEPLADAELEQRVRALLANPDEARIGAMIETYRRSRSERNLPHGNRALAAAIASDALFRIPSERFGDAYRPQSPATFQYLFTYESPSMRGALRSCHALELPFMFGTLDAPGQDRFAGTGEHVSGLSARMMDAWLAFARTGDPSLPGAAWPAFEVPRRPNFVFDLESKQQDAPYEEERATWDDLTPRSLIC